MQNRGSGIIMPIFSLPSPHGIGTLGQAAYDFADFLAEAGQSYWQMLPLGPTCCGDSPYSASSSAAGNPYLIDLDDLVRRGMLTKDEIGDDWGDDLRHVDYTKLYDRRYELLSLAKSRAWNAERYAIEAFRRENAQWLESYALYSALKEHFSSKPWTEWPDEGARHRDAETLAKYGEALRERVELHIFVQYLFYSQWGALKKYINSLGIKIIGDLPIYVSLDSADVWSEPQFFALDSRLVPCEVAGVPPDYFSEKGQLWGNPLYNYDKMRADGYGWWIRRVSCMQRLYDVVRIDHFRGLESYWAVPNGAEDARSGHWVKGPGMSLVGVLTSWFSGMEFIAEDLGTLTPEVGALLRESGLPGMKVLEFAFDPSGTSCYLPHNYTDPNCVCYTGTHDNSPLAMWLQQSAPKELDFARRYLGVDEGGDLARAVLRAGSGSTARLFMAQMQDYLGLGEGCRTNVPGIAFGNWRWRMLPGEATKELAQEIHAMAALYGRAK